MHQLNKDYDTIEEKEDRCVQVMDFIQNYRLDQKTADEKKKEQERQDAKVQMKDYKKMPGSKKLLSLSNLSPPRDNESLPHSPFSGAKSSTR